MKETIFRANRYQTNDYLLELKIVDGTKRADLYLTSLLQKKFKTPMLYTYNGVEWIKTSGGNTVRTTELEGKILDEDLERVKEFFKRGGLKTIDELYHKLREMVKVNVDIVMSGRVGRASVHLVFLDNQYCWTSFEGKTLEEALERTIEKLLHPEQDYVDIDGTVWSAKDDTVYGENHIRLFLKGW